MNFIHMFNMIDTDNSGEITKTELIAFMKANNFNENFVEKWLTLFDFNKKGIITMDDYCEILGLVIDEDMHKKLRKQRPSVLKLSGLDDYDDFVDVDNQMEQHLIHVSTNKPLSTPTISSSNYPPLKSPTKSPEVQNISPQKKTGFSFLKFFKTKDSKKKSNKESKDNTVTDPKQNKILNRLSASLPRTPKRSPNKDDVTKHVDSDNKNLKVPPKRSKTLELHSSKSDITDQSPDKSKTDNQNIDRTRLKSDSSNSKEVSRENSKKINLFSKTDDKNIKASQEILHTDKSTNLSKLGKIINNIRHFSSKNQSVDKTESNVIHIEFQKETHSPKEKNVKPPSIQILKDNKKSKTKILNEPAVLKSHTDSSLVKEKIHSSTSEPGRISKDNESKNYKIKIAKSASAHEVKRRGAITNSNKNKHLINDATNEANQKSKASSVHTPIISISNEDGVITEITGSLKSKTKVIDSKSTDKHNKKDLAKEMKDESGNYFFGRDLDKVKNKKNVEKVKHSKTNSLEDTTKHRKHNFSGDKLTDPLNETKVKTTHSLFSKAKADHGDKDKSLKNKPIGDVKKDNASNALDDHLNDINEATIKVKTSPSLSSKPIESSSDRSSKGKNKHINTNSLESTDKHKKDDLNEIVEEMVESKTNYLLANKPSGKQPNVELEERKDQSKIISLGDSDKHIGDTKSNKEYLGYLNEFGKETTEVKLHHVLNSKSIETSTYPREKSKQPNRSLSEDTNKNIGYNKSNDLLLNILNEVGERKFEVKTNPLFSCNLSETGDHAFYNESDENLKNASTGDFNQYVGHHKSNEISGNVLNENDTNKAGDDHMLSNESKKTKICDNLEILDLIESIRTEINKFDKDNRTMTTTSKDETNDNKRKIKPPTEQIDEEKINESLKNVLSEKKPEKDGDILLIRKNLQELNDKLINDKSGHGMVLVKEMLRESNLGDRIKEIILENQSENSSDNMLPNPEDPAIIEENVLSVLHDIVSNKTMTGNQNEVFGNIQLIKTNLPIGYSNEKITFGFEENNFVSKPIESGHVVSGRLEDLNSNYNNPKKQLPEDQNTGDYNRKLMLDKNIIPGKTENRIKDSTALPSSKTNNLSSFNESLLDSSHEDKSADYIDLSHSNEALKNNEDQLKNQKSTIFPKDKTAIDKSSNVDKIQNLRLGEDNLKSRDSHESPNRKSKNNNLTDLKDNKENLFLNLKLDHTNNEMKREVSRNDVMIENTKQIKESSDLGNSGNGRGEKFPNYDLLKSLDNSLYPDISSNITTSNMTSQMFKELCNNESLELKNKNLKIGNKIDEKDSFENENKTSYTLTTLPNENIKIAGIKVDNVNSGLANIDRERSNKPLTSGEKRNTISISQTIKNSNESIIQDPLEIEQTAIKELVVDDNDITLCNRPAIDSDFASQFRKSSSNLDGSKDMLPEKKETESEVVLDRKPNIIYKPSESSNKDLLIRSPLGNIAEIDTDIEPYTVYDLTSSYVENLDDTTTVRQEFEPDHKKKEDLIAQLSKYFRNKENQRDMNKKIKIIHQDLDDVFLPDILNNIVDIYEGKIPLEHYNCEEVIKRFLDRYYDLFWNVIISKNEYELYFTYESMLIFQYDNLSFIIWKTSETIY